ncbi:nuclear-interacting partner of ALK [Osmerus eperlanus]|uniref:nuclear-interacting partner of ALK n=1 Tax=Osmerus eperlanus TaxID=29151 RepID=UPI002E1248B0
MATLGSRGNRLDNSNKQCKSVFASPEKVRELLNEGVVSEENRSNGVKGNLKAVESNDIPKVPFEATNKDAFFTRVESYSCLKWAGKPQCLSPLRCASYGWINVGCDMLKCSSCQAFLCASLQPTLDFLKYESRIAEVSRQLQTQHEKFCPWPDFPCPDRFWLVPANEPSVLLSAFLERFQSACILEQQLPAMSPEQLKNMSLTEDIVSVLLQLIEEEQKKLGRTPTSETLAVQVAACIVSLCGWAASPTLHAMSLPMLVCSYCMRKVGLWNFHQMEGSAGGGDSSVPSTPTRVQSPTPTHVQDTRGDRGTPTSPSPSSTPSRMKLRSQDSTRSDQTEGSPAPMVVRTRSRDSPSPSEELPSPLARGKKPSARGRGQGEGPGSPQHHPKRLRLSSAGGPEGPLHRNIFDPLAQHRDWCPWVNTGKENTKPEDITLLDGDAEENQPGWKAALSLLLPMKKTSDVTGRSPSQGPHDKSKRVFAIFRQWQISSPSQ